MKGSVAHLGLLITPTHLLMTRNLVYDVPNVRGGIRKSLVCLKDIS